MKYIFYTSVQSQFNMADEVWWGGDQGGATQSERDSFLTTTPELPPSWTAGGARRAMPFGHNCYSPALTHQELASGWSGVTPCWTWEGCMLTGRGASAWWPTVRALGWGLGVAERETADLHWWLVTCPAVQMHVTIHCDHPCINAVLLFVVLSGRHGNAVWQSDEVNLQLCTN